MFYAIKPINLRDGLEELLDLELDCYGEDALSLWSIKRILNRRNTEAWGLETDIGVVGYCITNHLKTRNDIIRLGVLEECRGRGYGSSLIQFIKETGTVIDPHVSATVQDNNVGAHLFLRSCGFFATQVLNGKDGDAYVFRYHPSVKVFKSGMFVK